MFDGDALADLRPDETNRAKELIEDFMIAANGMTASYLEEKGLPVAATRAALPGALGADRRAGRGAMGEHLPSEPNAQALEDFLKKRRRTADPVRFPDVSLSVVKLLGRGEYVARAPGRAARTGISGWPFGTTPIRPHRTAAFPISSPSACLKPRWPDSPRRMARRAGGLARHCTEQEDNAAKVERQVRKSAAALLLQAGSANGSTPS